MTLQGRGRTISPRIVAERALENAQTLSLIGEDFKAFKELIVALGLIAKYGAAIPHIPDPSEEEK